MPAESYEFTDKQLADLYLSLKTQYLQLDRNLSLQEVYENLGCALLLKITTPGGSYSSFRNQTLARKKIFDIFHFFISTIPQARHSEIPLVPRQENWFSYDNYHLQHPQSDVPRIQLFPTNFQNNTSSWFDIFMRLPQKHDANAVCKWLFLLMVTGVVLTVAYISCCYVYNVIFDNIDRLVHNEGRMYAVISMLSVLIGAAIGVVSSVIIFASIFNPLGTLFILSGAAIMFGAGTGYITNCLHNTIVRNSNANALDPNDPYRFGLTASEDRNLQFNDSMLSDIPESIKVKCAIVALRAEIGNMPAASLRLFAKNSPIQAHLDGIRKLRKGVRTPIRLGEFELNFNGITREPMPVHSTVKFRGIPLEYRTNAEPVMGQVVRH